MMSGFGGRFLYFYSDEDYKINESFYDGDIPKIPSVISESITRWDALKQIEKSKSDRPYPESLPIQDSALDKLKEIRNYFFNLNKKIDETSPVSPVLQRSYENIERLSIIHACSNSPNTVCPIIKVETVDWAFNLIETLNHNNKHFLLNNISSSYFEKQKLKVIRMIQANKGFMERSVLLKNSHIKAKELDEILDTLIQSDVIEELNIKGKKVYQYKDNNE